jgi:hypothetical protein
MDIENDKTRINYMVFNNTSYKIEHKNKNIVSNKWLSFIGIIFYYFKKYIKLINNKYKKIYNKVYNEYHNTNDIMYYFLIIFLVLLGIMIFSSSIIGYFEYKESIKLCSINRNSCKIYINYCSHLNVFKDNKFDSNKFDSNKLNRFNDMVTQCIVQNSSYISFLKQIFETGLIQFYYTVIIGSSVILCGLLFAYIFYYVISTIKYIKRMILIVFAKANEYIPLVEVICVSNDIL